MRMAFAIESSQPTSFVLTFFFSAVKWESLDGEGGGGGLKSHKRMMGCSSSFVVRVKNVVLYLLACLASKCSQREVFILPFRVLSQKNMTGDNVLRKNWYPSGGGRNFKPRPQNRVLLPLRVYLPTLTPLAWVSRLRVESFDLTPAHACRPISHAWLKKCELLPSCLTQFPKIF